MGKLRYVKSIYGNPKHFDDILHDSLWLIAKNISANHERCKGKMMDEGDIIQATKLFNEKLKDFNELPEYNITS